MCCAAKRWQNAINAYGYKELHYVLELFNGVGTFPFLASFVPFENSHQQLFSENKINESGTGENGHCVYPVFSVEKTPYSHSVITFIKDIRPVARTIPKGCKNINGTGISEFTVLTVNSHICNPSDFTR